MTLYEQDFYAWTQAQAALLEARQFDVLDIVNLVDEVTALGVSERRALGSHLIILVLHLLKWRYQLDGRLTSHSRFDSIRQARLQIDLLLDTSPSLRPLLPGMLTRYYPKARRIAADETHLAFATFPEMCPWSLDQLLAYDFFPESYSGSQLHVLQHFPGNRVSFGCYRCSVAYPSGNRCKEGPQALQSMPDASTTWRRLTVVLNGPPVPL